MVYIIYRKRDGEAIQIQEHTPKRLSDDLSFVERKDFNLHDLDTYNIFVKSDNVIFSIEKSEVEKESIRLKKENQALNQQLSQAQSKLLQTQLAVAELGATTAQSKTDMQLAIAELAATMTKGAE